MKILEKHLQKRLLRKNPSSEFENTMQALAKHENVESEYDYLVRIIAEDKEINYKMYF